MCDCVSVLLSATHSSDVFSLLSVGRKDRHEERLHHFPLPVFTLTQAGLAEAADDLLGAIARGWLETNSRPLIPDHSQVITDRRMYRGGVPIGPRIHV